MPAPDRLASDIGSWLRTEYVDFVRSTAMAAGPNGGTVLSVGLHPAAPPLQLLTEDEGKVTATATTSSAGPGYHTFVAHLLRRLGTELSIAWAAGEGDPGGATVEPVNLESVERPAVERTHLAWLHDVLGRAREARRRGASGLHLGTPDGALFAVDGAIATVLGPRDDAWLEEAADSARTAVEIWPWFLDATDARYLLGRALTAMWIDLRWRPPATEDEARSLDEVLGLLRQAFPLDPSLPYPWREWREAIALRGAADDAMARQVGERADKADKAGARSGAAPLIGYRRGPVTILNGGWALTVPGSFGERRVNGEWTGGEGGREITFAAVETAADGGPMTPEAFLGTVAGHLGGDALSHRDGPVVGRARITVDSSSGLDVATLEAYSAVAGRGAAIRITIDQPDDWQWALETWRALKPA